MTRKNKMRQQFFMLPNNKSRAVTKKAIKYQSSILNRIKTSIKRDINNVYTDLTN